MVCVNTSPRVSELHDGYTTRHATCWLDVPSGTSYAYADIAVVSVTDSPSPFSRYVFLYGGMPIFPDDDQVFVLFRPLRDRALKAPTAQFRQPLPILALDGDSSVFGGLEL